MSKKLFICIGASVAAGLLVGTVAGMALSAKLSASKTEISR